VHGSPAAPPASPASLCSRTDGPGTLVPVVTVRVGGPDDLEAGIDVWRAANSARLGRPLPAQHETRVRSYGDAEGFFFVVAEDGGSVVAGAIGMQGRADDGRGPPEPGLCHVSMVFVAPARWGQGIGGRLLDALLGEARARGYDRLQLWTDADNDRAQALFERTGLRRTGREKLDDLGTPSVHYAHSL
jgi:ribosomal protein S18 acetylase RimI-like enzyme